VYIHVSQGGGGSINYKTIVYKQYGTLIKVRLNYKVVGRSKLIKRQNMIAVLCAVLKVMNYSF